MREAINSLFRRKKSIRIGLYGPVNSGKTTLANRISMDWLGEELGAVSEVPHETREIVQKEKVTMKYNGKSITFNLVDTPGIATRIDYEEFLKHGIEAKDAKKRAREATKGVIEAIKWLDDMDLVIFVLDATMDPINQVNITMLGNLDARDIPVLIAANKIDMKGSRTQRIKSAFPPYKAVGISAKNGNGISELYRNVLELVG
ncbi:MAG: GTP-binding protein [Candidatus Aenigmarchaeota archaeon]|nr:GTP-binding protein [Candidatus Aenigmarchaeota archaeon]